MTFTDYLPPKTWAFIVKLADENDLSTKEVQRILLNKVAFDLGLICEHKRMGNAKKDPEQPYCKDCWTRFKKATNREYSYETKKWVNVYKFLPKETFLDLNTQDQRQVEVEDREEFI